MKQLFVVLVAACFFIACNNSAENSEVKEDTLPPTIEKVTPGDDTAARMMDPTDMHIHKPDTTGRRPHQ